MGALQPDHQGVESYQNPRDLSHFEMQLFFQNALYDALKRVSQQCALQLNAQPPSLDPRLCIAARWVGEAISRGQNIPQGQVVRFVGSHFGLCAPIPWVIQLRGLITDREETIIERFYDHLHQAISEASPRLNMGIAQVSIDEYEQVTLLLIQPQYLAVRPFSRHLSGDMGVIIQGELLEPSPLELWITPPSGTPFRESLSQDGLSFSFQLNHRQRGVYQIELLGEGRSGPIVCLNAPIYRSIKPPVELALTSFAPSSRLMWINRLRLKRLIQQTRVRAKLPKLKSNLSITKVAQRYSAEMASQDFISHTSPRGEHLSHRAEEMGLRTEKILENLAVGTNIDEIHDRLMSSPAHRSALLDEEVTHFGVGISRKGNMLFGAELFTVLTRRLKLNEDLTEAYRHIQAHRKSHGLGRLPHAKELEEVALKVARALMSGACLPHESEHHCTHLLHEEKGLHFPIEVLTFRVNRVTQIPHDDTWLLDQVKSVGLGLAQGGPQEPIWTVLVLRLKEKSPSQLTLEP
jgi:uncharacterized protein YkwD